MVVGLHCFYILPVWCQGVAFKIDMGADPGSVGVAGPMDLESVTISLLSSLGGVSPLELPECTTCL